MSPRESLLDTFPGRLFIDHLRILCRRSGVTPQAFVGALGAEDLFSGVDQAVGRYLYSDGCFDEMHLDADDSELAELDAAAAAVLSKLSTFDSPQIHQGTLEQLHAPCIGNRIP